MLSQVNENIEQGQFDHDATYSPEDNKIRIYPAYRFDKEDYLSLRNAGFRWAPKQEIFVAPKWTPEREKIAFEFCGTIGDEDTSFVDRALIRAERFENYQEKRANEAETAYEGVKDITDNIPMGQPILIGHHSEKHARRHAQKIENGMKKATSLWDTSKYWEYRVKGVLRNAKYKELPAVRSRRIKKLEAEKRSQERTIKETKKWLNAWLYPVIFSKTRALLVINYSSVPYDLWSDFDKGVINHKEARNIDVPRRESIVKNCEKWINHLNMRLTYEKKLLEAQGAVDLLKPKKRLKLPPLCNYEAPGGISIENLYHKGEFSIYLQEKMTKAEYKKIWSDYKGTRMVENSHRVRTAMINQENRLTHVCIFLTDSKVHKKPVKIELKPVDAPLSLIKDKPVYKAPEKTKFDDLKESLKGQGVQVVSVPQLFPTPEKIAQRMVELADIQPGETVLEPSAGTGNLVKAVLDNVDTEVLAYELNNGLCKILSKKFPGYKCQVRQGDFLSIADFMGQYPKIIMNPPFENGADIKHIKHAVKFLASGGRLVALCANGSSQNKELKTIAEDSGGFWEDLPKGSFKKSGTMVNSALLVIEK